MLVLVAHVHLAVSGWLVPGSIEHYLPLYVLSYLYLGMTQPPGTAVLFVPISAASFAIATSAGTDNIVNFLVALPVGLICAEILSRLLRLRVREAADLARVLDSTKQLVASTSTDEAALILEELIAGLAGSHGVVVLIAATDQPGHFVGRHLAGEPSELAPVRVELGSDEGLGAAFREGKTVTIPLTHPVARVPAYLTASGAAAVTYVPLLDGTTGLGAIVVTWPRSRPDLDDSTAQMVELVAAEAGPILKGLRDRDRLNIEAETDPLTGLANRRTFNRALDASGEGDALVMIDLDRFKAVNDAHGHATGDEVLRTLGACLTGVAREEDCVSRFGGEEFAVILPKAGTAGVRSFLERLREGVGRRGPLDDLLDGVRRPGCWRGRGADPGPGRPGALRRQGPAAGHRRRGGVLVPRRRVIGGIRRRAGRTGRARAPRRAGGWGRRPAARGRRRSPWPWTGGGRAPWPR